MPLLNFVENMFCKAPSAAQIRQRVLIIFCNLTDYNFMKYAMRLQCIQQIHFVIHYRLRGVLHEEI